MQKDRHLGRYLSIIRDSPVYPVIYDSNRVVLSMPPVINGDHTKITLDTKDVLIECTATDKAKVEVVINMLVTMFSMHCAEPFTVEPIKIHSPHNHESREEPNLTPRPTRVEVSYINSSCGLSLSPADICTRLRRMGYKAAPSNSPAVIDVQVPPTRADVLHQADIMEDVAISYGFNNLPRSFPSRAAAIAAPLPLNKVADIVRLEAAMAGWSEVLPLILCSHDENFAWLNQHDDGKTAVRLQNPKTLEYQIVRTSLVPGLLKCIRENKHHSVPIKVFEVSDVAFKDESKERKSRNERHFAAAWYGKTSGFEMVHGLLDRIMLMLKSAFLTGDEAARPGKLDGHWIEQVDSALYVLGFHWRGESNVLKPRSQFPQGARGDRPSQGRRKASYNRSFRHTASHSLEKLRATVSVASPMTNAFGLRSNYGSRYKDGQSAHSKSTWNFSSRMPKLEPQAGMPESDARQTTSTLSERAAGLVENSLCAYGRSQKPSLHCALE